MVHRREEHSAVLRPKKHLYIPHRLYACGASFRICPATAVESSTHVAH
ncbi:MAG: hypothetical protein ACFFDI_15285 [Promethearchaeota archaeon]